MNIDYIIVGQGICGTFLSYYLMQEKQSVYVIDNHLPNSASRIASGVINPVTGRRIVKTWKIDEVMPFARKAYEDICIAAELENVLKEVSVLDIHTSEQMKDAFEKRLLQDEHSYLHAYKNENDWSEFFQFEYGIGEINPAYRIDINKLLKGWGNYLYSLKCVCQEDFSQSELVLKDDCVVYKNIVAKKIIFCDGIASATNPNFNHLPFAFNKGEALIVSIPDLPREYIYKQGFSLVPWEDDDLFWIGSSYLWDFEDDKPTNEFGTKVENYLVKHLKLSYSIKNHLAAIRPANTGRRPFVGLHNVYSQIGILNGMGTKGCSLAPYYAYQLAQYILYGIPIDEEVNVNRFWK